MNTIRRGLLAATTLALTLGVGHAQTFPNQPINIIVPSGPGGPADILARIVAPKMSENLGRPVVVENRPGASGTIALNAATRAEPNGYTLAFISETHAGAEALYPQRGYTLVDDFDAVGAIANIPLLLAVNNALPVRSVEEFIAYSRQNPGKLSFASGGAGNVYHLAAELFMQMTDTKYVHVPYSNAGQGRTDLISGQVQFMFDAVSSIQANVVANQVRALGVTTLQRFPKLPDVPTIAEAGVPGFNIEIWTGLVAPDGTPPDIINRLNQALNVALKDPNVQQQFENVGSTALVGSAADFQRSVADGVARWDRVIRNAGIKLD